MQKKLHFRKRYFVEPELQFWFVLVLVLVGLIEGTFVGYGISRLLAIASDWQRTHIVIDFFKTLILVLFPLIVVNFILGIYLSHKIAGPLFRLRRVLREIREGKLSHMVHLRRGDVLKDFFREFNETVFVLNKLVHRNKELIKQVFAQLEQCQEILNKKPSIEDIKKVQKIFTNIRSFLVAVDSHFIVSPDFFPEEKDNEKKNSSDS